MAESNIVYWWTDWSISAVSRFVTGLDWSVKWRTYRERLYSGLDFVAPLPLLLAHTSRSVGMI